MQYSEYLCIFVPENIKLEIYGKKENVKCGCRRRFADDEQLRNR